jgi:excisionase family DNA binding protein
MPPLEQFTFFASLDFPGRTVLTVAEISERLGYARQHILDLIAEGELTALNGAGKGAMRSSIRVPIEGYRNFILSRLTGPMRNELLRVLPEPTRTALILELFSGLEAAARATVLHTLRTGIAA